MTVDGPQMPPETMLIEHSEASSASPVFSGTSEIHDEVSSTETTPPPMSEAGYPVPETKRHSSSSIGFSRSYRSIPSGSYTESTVSPGLPPHRLSGADFRPTTSGTDDSGLAAAAELLNFGTPRTKATQIGSDIPPVPPLPQQYQSYSTKIPASSSTVYHPLSMHPPALTQQLSDERESRMGDGDRRKDFISHLEAHAHADDEEMFKMEE